LLTEGLRKDSKWAPYLAILPSQLDSLVFWSESELSELQASAVVQKIGKAGAEAMFSAHISPLGLENGNAEMCHRVASVIMAYAFDIPEKSNSDEENDNGGDDDGDELVSDDEEDEKTILSMIPLADMLNADADRNNARLCCDGEDLEMRSIKPITKGEEIFNDYGSIPRSDLLRRYGYVTQNYSPYDVAEISSDLLLSLFRSAESIPVQNSQSIKPLSLSEIGHRIALAEREGVFEDSYDLCHPGADGPSISDQLLALVYLLLLDDENSKAIEKSQSALPSRSKLATEIVGKVLVKAIELREKEYATTLEEDEELLQAGKITGRTAMAVQVRHGEKIILRKAVQEALSFTASDKKMRVEQNVRRESSISSKRKLVDANIEGGKEGKKGRR
jgi:SET domain-containing protein 6